VRTLAVTLATLLALATPGAALAACQKTSVADLEDEIMCPVCGTSLATAGDAPLAVQQRRLIDGLVNECKSKKQIKAALVAQYGDSVLADPEKKGFGLTTYLVPGAAFAAGLVLVALAALRWRRGRPAAGAPLAAPTGPTTPDSARLDDDMRRYDL
jgi:cytochrome c-type biogenesis protein CcmH/NrfF